MSQVAKPIRPAQVALAISLMAVNVVLINIFRTLSVILGILSDRITSVDGVFKSIDEVIIWGFSIGLLALIWNGVNWARWLNLILATLSTGLLAYQMFGAVKTQTYSALLIPAVYVALEAIALYLLFLSPGRVWFEAKEQSAAAQ